YLLAEAARLFSLVRGDASELANIRASNERFAAGARQDHAAYRRVFLSILEGGPQVRPSRRIQGVENPGTIDRDIGHRVFFLIQDICQRQRGLARRGGPGRRYECSGWSGHGRISRLKEG